MGTMTLVYLIQHGEKEPLPGDPGLTGTGREQAIRTGRWLRSLGVSVLYSSSMRRARETAEGIASVTGLTVRCDARLRERLNWDGSMPFQAFLDLWAKTTRYRDWIPAAVLAAGIPPCAVTAVDDMTVVMIASLP